MHPCGYAIRTDHEAGPEGPSADRRPCRELKTLLLPPFSASLHTAGTARGQERVSNPAMARRLQGGEEELATHVGQGGVNLGVTWGLVVTNNLGPSARVPSGHRGFSQSCQTLQQSWPVSHGLPETSASNALFSLRLKQPMSGQRFCLLLKIIRRAIYFLPSNHYLIFRYPSGIHSCSVM